MHTRIRNILIFVLGVALATSLQFLIFHWPGIQEKLDVKGFDQFPGISLIPPVSAVEGSPTTPPLNTSEIGLIAYYEHYMTWTLADTVPAFISYFDGGNYYDGIVRVWDSGTIGEHSPVTEDTNIDVNVRVRADGWILAWFNRTAQHGPGAIVWWGHTRREEGSPPQYSTTLSRAVEIVFTVAGESYPFPGHEAVGMYDYEEPNATRLLIFGHSIRGSGETRIYYYTIAANSTMEPIKLLICAGGDSPYPDRDYYARLLLDGIQIYSRTTVPWGWTTFPTPGLEKGIQHAVEQYVGGYSSASFHSVAFIMWAK